MECLIKLFGCAGGCELIGLKAANRVSGGSVRDLRPTILRQAVRQAGQDGCC